jgi:hypothetical protein
MFVSTWYRIVRYSMAAVLLVATVGSNVTKLASHPTTDATTLLTVLLAMTKRAVRIIQRRPGVLLNQFECHSGECINAATENTTVTINLTKLRPALHLNASTADLAFRWALLVMENATVLMDCADRCAEELYRDMFSHAHCKQSRLCITNLRCCDEDDDCEHGEDVSNCSGPSSCPANLRILHAFTLCNGADDCIHATNEQRCASLDISHPPAADVTCAPNHFSSVFSSGCV